MKRILLSIICGFILVNSALANDGTFYVSGNTLIPLQETSVSLKREILKFYVKDFRWLSVEVDFEFYNPGREKKVTVGFVTPPAVGDLVEKDEKHPRIKDFTVTVNGENLPFEIKKMKETSFSMEKLKIYGEDFVYYFPVTFKTGLNKIRHTYQYEGGSSVELQRVFDYQITTGKRWANKQIDDFELQIHLDHGIFAVPASFVKGRPANWQIVGDGVMTRTATRWLFEDSPLVKLAHLNRGYLLLREKNFRPAKDIFLGEYNWPAGWITKMCKTRAKCPDVEKTRDMVGYFTLNPNPNPKEEYLSELTRDELKIIRNFAYAARGYNFTDKMLADFYSQFFWYKPDRNLKTEDIKLNDNETLFIAKVKRMEESRGN
jgi:hypothetical protein